LPSGVSTASMSFLAMLQATITSNEDPKHLFYRPDPFGCSKPSG
jgi:hypothetical protein